MAKEVAVGKRAKISEAQQYMLLSVLVAAVFLGIAISLISHFVKQITFNMQVISAEDEAIVSYSNLIKNTGICTKPSGNVYSEEELKKCNPDSIEVSQVPGTLRSNILENMAANQALNSVPNESNPSCINPETEKQFTYKELNQLYKEASGSEALNNASKLIKSCSALRVIPDALPAFKNEEALLASLNKLFNDSGWKPESLSPSGTTEKVNFGTGLHAISIGLSVEADSGTTMNVLHNIERSIREFNIGRATIEWGGNNVLKLQAQATAYYMDESKVTEATKTISTEEK